MKQKTTVNPKKLLDEFLVLSFDHLCKVIEGSICISAKDWEGGFKTDLFAWANEETRNSALEMYPIIRNAEVEEFRKFMEEEHGGEPSVWMKLHDDSKIEAYGEFCVLQKTSTLVKLIENEDFNPLHFTGFSDGLAVLCVRNQQELRKEILEKVSEWMKTIETDLEKFISMSFSDQKRISCHLERYLIPEIQSIDWRFPKMPAAS